MAVSSTSTFELTRDQIIRRACQLAGLYESSQSPDPDTIAMAAEFMGMEILALQAEGLVLGTVERTTLALVAGTKEYTLPADTLDVMVGPQNVAGTVYAGGSSENPVRAIYRHEYQTGISNKDTEATPTTVYIERSAELKLVFYPVPREDGTFRYDRQRLMRDLDTGARTLDLQRKWQKAITYAIAWQVALAKSIPMERVDYLRKVAEAEKATVRVQDNEKGAVQIYIPRMN